MRIADIIVEYKQYPTQEYEGVTFTMMEKDGQLIVKALNDFGLPMGHVVFGMDGQELDPKDLEVYDRYQGQGIARVMYDYIKSQGFTINRSFDQTDAGRGFWDKHRGEDSVVWETDLNESLSRVAYHYTYPQAALRILNSGYFELSAAPGSIEQQYSPPGRHYFLSATRTKTGGYHAGGKWRGAIFNLDGNWFNQRYRSGPIDYWGNRGSGMRQSEAEDRIYSSEPTIPINGVTAVHVYLNTRTTDSEQLQHDSSVVRQILIAAKTRGIPAYFYDNHDAWILQDTRHTADVGQLTGSRKPNYYRGHRRRTYMHDWLELMGATAPNQLTASADKLRHNLNYDYDRRSAAQSLETDMANARKPDSGPERDTAVKIIRYMTQHRLNTMSDFVEHIAAKWKNIK